MPPSSYGKRPLACHRCGRRLEPERVDLDGWLILDARQDGWALVVCHSCQRPSERERIRPCL